MVGIRKIQTLRIVFGFVLSILTIGATQIVSADEKVGSDLIGVSHDVSETPGYRKLTIINNSNNSTRMRSPYFSGEQVKGFLPVLHDVRTKGFDNCDTVPEGNSCSFIISAAEVDGENQISIGDADPYINRTISEDPDAVVVPIYLIYDMGNGRQEMAVATVTISQKKAEYQTGKAVANGFGLASVILSSYSAPVTGFLANQLHLPGLGPDAVEGVISGVGYSTVDKAVGFSRNNFVNNFANVFAMSVVLASVKCVAGVGPKGWGRGACMVTFISSHLSGLLGGEIIGFLFSEKVTNNLPEFVSKNSAYSLIMEENPELVALPSAFALNAAMRTGLKTLANIKNGGGLEVFADAVSGLTMAFIGVAKKDTVPKLSDGRFTISDDGHCDECFCSDDD